MSEEVDKSFIRRTVVFNKKVDEEVERVRRRLEMSKSEFIRYSVLRMLEELNVLSAKPTKKVSLKEE
ncbi:MAG: hypothetical protein QW502_00425 [Candidatus Bathyarchaeia archaeon]|nr:hypothetical protein [Candidatus Bathyarchaeota archaeon]